MSFTVSSEATQGTQKDFAIPTAGMKQAVLIGVYDLGWHESPYKNEDGSIKRQHKCALTFEINEVNNGEGEFTGKRFVVSKVLTASMHEKATLRKMIGSWRGVAVTDAEAKAFDLEQLIGQRATLNIVHQVRNDKTYYSVNDVLPPMSEVNFTPENEVPFPAPKWVVQKQEEAKANSKKAQSGDDAPAVDPYAMYPKDAKNQQRISEYNMITMKMGWSDSDRVDHLKQCGNDFTLAINGIGKDDEPDYMKG